MQKPSSKRVIPTERLDELCVAFRNYISLTKQVSEKIAWAVGKSDLDLEWKMQIIAWAKEVDKDFDCLAATEMYLRYNKKRLIDNRRRAAGYREEPQPSAYIPAEVHEYIPDCELPHQQTPQEIAKEWEEYQRWNRGEVSQHQPPHYAPTFQPPQVVEADATTNPSTTLQLPQAAVSLTDSSGTTHTFTGQTLPEILDKSALSIRRKPPAA